MQDCTIKKKVSKNQFIAVNIKLLGIQIALQIMLLTNLSFPKDQLAPKYVSK